MYYIPGAQKNVYLKEVSTLVKAIRKTGGIEPIAHGPDLNVVRNLLLDWVSAGLGDTGPESLARMIKLDVKQAQAVPTHAEISPAPVRADAKVVGFQVLHHASGAVTVLGQDPAWVSSLEKDSTLAQRLATGVPFTVGDRRVFVLSSASFAAGRALYQCIALAPGA